MNREIVLQGKSEWPAYKSKITITPTEIRFKFSIDTDPIFLQRQIEFVKTLDSVVNFENTVRGRLQGLDVLSVSLYFQTHKKGGGCIRPLAGTFFEK